MSASGALPLGPLILDSGSVLAFIAGEPFARIYCLRVQQAGFPLIVPTAVYAQVECGDSQHSSRHQRLNTLLKFCVPAPLSMAVARQAGVLLGLSGTSDIVDAVVVVEALSHDGGVIFTSDSGDIHYLLGFSPNRQRRGGRGGRI